MAEEKTNSESMLTELRSINRKLEKINNPPLWRSLLQGMLTGLGTVIGATLLLAILLAILRPLINAPLVGQWVTDIVKVVDRNTEDK